MRLKNRSIADMTARDYSTTTGGTYTVTYDFATGYYDLQKGHVEPRPPELAVSRFTCGDRTLRMECGPA